MNRSLLRTGGLIVATALVSGGTAYAVSSNQSPTKTIVRQVSAPVAQDTSQQPSTGLSVNEIYRRSAPGVVVVRSTVTTTQQNSFGAPQQEQSQALGSGFVIDQAGPHPDQRPRRRRRHQGRVGFADRRRLSRAGRRARQEHRRGRAQGRRFQLRACAPSPWQLQRRAVSATRSSRSATRSARPARSPAASSRRSTARSSRCSPTTASSARSRPTPRSTTATRAARCSTRKAR